MLEVRTRVQKKLDEVEALKAGGLSEREIQQEAEGGSAILDFLKEHDRKTKEKAKVKRVIEKTEEGLQQVHEDIYGPPGQFIDCKVLLKQSIPYLDRSAPLESSLQKGVLKFNGMQSRSQMNKPGHRGDRSNPNAKLSTNEIANVPKSSNHVRKRTDTGNVRISTATGR